MTKDQTEAPAEKATIAHPFSGLKEGVGYNYTRALWPSAQDGKPQHGKTLKATAKAFPRVDEKGAIVNELRVKLEGGVRHHTLKELPQDATFTEV